MQTAPKKSHKPKSSNPTEVTRRATFAGAGAALSVALGGVLWDRSSAAADEVADLDSTLAALVESPSSETRQALDSNFVRGVSLHRVAGTLADLQAGVDRAAAQGVPLFLSGEFSLHGSVSIPDRLRVVGLPDVTIGQTKPLTPHFVATATKHVSIENVRFIGLATDYVNNETVYGSSAIKLFGANEHLLIDRCRIQGIAGAGVFVSSSTSLSIVVQNTTITGVGLAELGTSSYSAGIIVQDGIEDITITGCDISQIAQGIVVGHGSKRILCSGNRIHHTSEHGAYFATSSNYTISDNYFFNTRLLGLKIQNGKAGYTCQGALITDNHLESTGSNSIVITNAIAPGTLFIENIIMRGNVVSASGDTGIRVDSARAIILDGNLINGARFGVRLFTSSMIRVGGNIIMNTERTGLLVESCSHTVVESNSMLNLGTLGPEKVGIIVQGTVSGFALVDNTVDYDGPAQNDGVLFGAGTYSNTRVRGNYLRGANYGIRASVAVSSIVVWRDNTLVGGLGGFDAVPSVVPLLPNQNGQTLANVEIEVNKIKTVLREQRDAR